MNPSRFLLLLAIAALIGSCTKDYPTPLIESISPEPVESNLIENSPTESPPDRIAFFNPESISQPCKSNTQSLLRPRILKDNKIEIEYVNIQEYTNGINPKSIEWIVDGKTMPQLTTSLKLPYSVGQYAIETIVTLTDGSEMRFPEFTMDVTDNMPLDNKGYIDFDPDFTCVTGTTVGPSCLPQNGRALPIVVVDPIE